MRVRVKPTSSGFVGELVVPVEGATAITVSGWASDIRGAVRKAANVARRIQSDPLMAALIPPQARAAITAAQQLARAADAGAPALKAAVRKLRGPGAKRLARVLRRDVKRRPPPMRLAPPALPADELLDQTEPDELLDQAEPDELLDQAEPDELLDEGSP